ncbi:MAG: hypothetical protein O7F11_10225 [Acidobacteria bacterium]|nr:hypothetical protein [Acidobacteriota bacterium]
MNALSFSLLFAAAGVALIHTLLGPDHYLPFIMLARARRWSVRRTAFITTVCGLGHVGSSLLLGTLGIGMGLAVGEVQRLESSRGSLAAWGLMAFGVAYATWGLRKGIRRARGLEAHSHGGHVHLHRGGTRNHSHDRVTRGDNATFWTLFAIFILGPCEPLIPLFILPASRGDWGLAATTAGLFGIVTVVTMTSITLLGLKGLQPKMFAPLAHWDHALAGSVIASSGMAILFLGL